MFIFIWMLLAAAVRPMQEEIEKAKSVLRAELEEQHGLHIAAIKHEHAEALKATSRHQVGYRFIFVIIC